MSKWLSAMPIEEFRVVASELMRKVCSYRLPRPDRAYFKFEVESDCSYALYGRWIGYDDHGNEVRNPRPVDDQRAIHNIRNRLGQTLYVLHSSTEVAMWQSQWRGVALLPERLAKRAYPSAFTGVELLAATNRKQ